MSHIRQARVMGHHKQYRGVRLWSKADIERLRKVKERTYRKGRGRKKKKA